MVSAVPVALSASPTLTSIYQFTGGTDGGGPASALVPDHAGNVYGTAGGGGQVCAENTTFGCGTVYRLDPAGGFKVLHSFAGIDGQGPTGLGFKLGTLFGNTYGGGVHDDGTLFSMTTDGSNFTVLHSFHGTDGYEPIDNPLPAKHGGQFGITSRGGIGGRSGKGVLFYLAGDDSLHVLHKFTGGTDGQNPSTLVMDTAGNVFGTASEGGSCNYKSGCGLVFEYNAATRVYSIIYTFSNSAVDGMYPKLGAAGPDGTLYGVSYYGPHYTGVLFSLAPGTKGYSFAALANLPTIKGAGESEPVNAPALADNGDLVGETSSAIYGYANGTISTLGRIGPPPLLPSTTAPFLIGPNATLYGVSQTGPNSSCTYVTGFQWSEGCGYIFSYRLR